MGRLSLPLMHGNIDKLRDTTTQHGQTDASLAAEIATRLIEWRSTPGTLTESKPFKWLMRLAALGRDNPNALWLYLHIQTGDLDALTLTYDLQAASRATDRQAIQQKQHRALRDMQLHFPELKQVIDEMRKAFRPARGINRKDGAREHGEAKE